MRLRSNFKLRKVGNDYVLIDPDRGQVDLTRVYCFNSTAAFLIESLKDQEFDLDSASRILIDEFEINEDQALSDSRNILLQLKEHHLIQD